MCPMPGAFSIRFQRVLYGVILSMTHRQLLEMGTYGDWLM